jgi:hypothetical protein
MGIEDRDYMRRRPGGGAERGDSTDEKVEALFSGFLRKHPRLPVVVGITLVACVIIAILVAKFNAKVH